MPRSTQDDNRLEGERYDQGYFCKKDYEREIEEKNGEYHVEDKKWYVASERRDYYNFMDQDHPFAKRMREDPEEDERIGLLTFPIYQSEHSFDIDGEPYYVVYDCYEKRPKRIVYVTTEFCSCGEPESDEKAITDFTKELSRLKQIEKVLRKNFHGQENTVRMYLEKMGDEGKVPQEDSVSEFIEEYGGLKKKKNEGTECRIEIQNLEKRIRYHQKCASRGDRTKILLPQTGIKMICH